ncbi:hypothetical protein [Pseudomonas sp.]|uniref:hypothetical protein n=1 Tax=Pseudomonas sp. TaxID=306 RepID=UPI00290C7A15|nr:hypothetical protein [Pseudomonas sp.]MDU4254491.1 hypothetical protein [Pseudomonas sp.]
MTEQTTPGHNPTEQTYIGLTRAYDHFNRVLFDSSLPGCLITLQRQHDTYSYFSPNQFVNGSGNGELAHEIALNPVYFAIRPIYDTLASLVTEMISLKQLLTGTPGRKRYRNKEWADLMEGTGLMPSDTWAPGGKRVGEKVGCYVIEGGAFDGACEQLVDEAFRLSWVDRFPPKELRAGVQAFSDAEIGGGQDYAGAETDLLLPRVEQLGDAEGLSDLGADAAPGTPASAPADDLPWVDAGAPAPAPAAEHQRQPANAAPAPKAKPTPPVDLAALQALGVEPQEKRKGSTREKYTCPSCNSSVWGKPGLKIGCFTCDGQPQFKAVGLLGEPASEELVPATGGDAGAEG